MLSGIQALKAQTKKDPWKEFEYINLIKPELNDGIEAQEQTGGGDTDETEF